jgi:hypothetical protein
VGSYEKFCTHLHICKIGTKPERGENRLFRELFGLEEAKVFTVCAKVEKVPLCERETRASVDDVPGYPEAEAGAG